MRVIGITGGVGSGKSAALDILKEDLGAVLFIADDIGRQLMQPGQDCYRQIVNAFGRQILCGDGSIDRAALAGMAFTDRSILEKLNAIVHPAVISYIKEELGASSGEKGIAVIESALLYESGLCALCDEVWYIHASEQSRIERLEKSRGYTRQKCLDVMGNQHSDSWFLSKADKVIENGGTIEQLAQQLAAAVCS